MIGNIKIEADERDKRSHKPFGLSPGQTQEQPKVKGSLDRDIGVPTLATPEAGLARFPGFDRLGREPYGQASTLDQATIVGRPVRDAIASLVAGVDLRPFRHSQIMIEEFRRRKRGHAFRFMHQRRLPAPLNNYGRRLEDFY